MEQSPLYAAVNLGSNSFHLLIVRKVAGQVRIVSRVKRKVRLASGLDSNNNLSSDAMKRALTASGSLPSSCRTLPPRTSG